MTPAYTQERAALMDAADAIAADRSPRNERAAHAALLDAAAQHRRAHRIAPAPTGSREIPPWLLAVLLGVAVAVVVSVGPGAPLFATLLAATTP